MSRFRLAWITLNHFKLFFQGPELLSKYVGESERAVREVCAFNILVFYHLHIRIYISCVSRKLCKLSWFPGLFISSVHALDIFGCLRNERMTWDVIHGINECCISSVCLCALLVGSDSQVRLNICPVFLFSIVADAARRCFGRRGPSLPPSSSLTRLMLSQVKEEGTVCSFHSLRT